MAGGAYTMLSPVLPRIGPSIAEAHALGDPYPTIFIHLFGGLDFGMHWDAKTGLANRLVQAADIRETAGGIRWYEPVLAPLTAHMEEASIIRNLKVTAAHPSGTGQLWWGEGNTDVAANSTPWANYLASNLLARKKVASPAIATFRTSDEVIRNLTLHSNLSPNPAGAAQRVQNITDFSDSMDVLGGLPEIATQQRVYAMQAAMDAQYYSAAVQKRTTDAFLAGNVQATELLNQPPARVWPPAQTTQDLFNLSASDITSLVSQNNQRFIAHAAMAFEAARLQTSHVIYIQSTQNSYDTHNDHDIGQRNASNRYMPAIGSLLSALKATASPVDPSLSMLETTHVVITSELSRAASAQTGLMMNGEPFDGSGTPHNSTTQALLFGGNFRAGRAFGATNASLQAQPADFTTGVLGTGQNPNIKSLHSTVLKANGVDPSGWDSSPAIDFVLKG
jgi:hypothetical protein